MCIRDSGNTGASWLAPSAGDSARTRVVPPVGPVSLRVDLGAIPGILKISPARRRIVGKAPCDETRL
eukprot:3749054-Alexandrium_andersonii.AAC.1